MDQKNQFYFSLETTLSKEAHELFLKQKQKEKTKNLSILYMQETICYLHSFILEEDEFEDTISLFIQNEVVLPNNMNPKLIHIIVNYLYLKEINNLSFLLIFDLLSLAIFFRLRNLIQKIVEFLKNNITDLNRVVFIMKHIYPMTFLETSNPNCNFRLLFDNCERFLLKEKCYDEFFNFFINELFKYNVDVEAELLHHIKLLKESKSEEIHILNLINFVKDKFILFKKEKDQNFDCSKYFEKLIENNIDLKRIDQNLFFENITLLNLDIKELEKKVMVAKISHLECINNNQQAEIVSLKQESKKVEVELQIKTKLLIEKIEAIKDEVLANHKNEISTLKKQFQEEITIIRKKNKLAQKELTSINNKLTKSLIGNFEFERNQLVRLQLKFQTIKFHDGTKFKYLISILNFNSLDDLDIRLQLLYRGSEQNFSGERFHHLCDNEGPTLVLIKSSLGKTFGAFANASWNSNGEDISAPGSFIFSLDHSSSHPVLDGQEKKALFGSKIKSGPVFGDGIDIIISDKCNRNIDSYCNFGKSYSLPNGLKFESEGARNYLAGGYKFSVEEYEIFSLI